MRSYASYLLPREKRDQRHVFIDLDQLNKQAVKKHVTRAVSSNLHIKTVKHHLTSPSEDSVWTLKAAYGSEHSSLSNACKLLLPLPLTDRE